MIPSISGSEAFTLFKELKSLYGVKQNAVAAALGISRQAVTDMKANRRRLTRPMAERLLQEYAAEPWVRWLRTRLDSLFMPEPTRFAIPAELPPHMSKETANALNASADTSSPPVTKRTGLPVLTSLCQGEPPVSSSQRYTVIPNGLSTQTVGFNNSYIYIIDFDSRDGRLRRGDQVLVLQDAERDSEIRVVRHKGALRLARRGRHERAINKKYKEGDGDWVLLDSGVVISENAAMAVGCIVGIVMALL